MTDLKVGTDKTTGCVVLYDSSDNIVAWIPDGKMSPPMRREPECEVCNDATLRTANKLARGWALATTNDLAATAAYNSGKIVCQGYRHD